MAKVKAFLVMADNIRKAVTMPSKKRTNTQRGRNTKVIDLIDEAVENYKEVSAEEATPKPKPPKQPSSRADRKRDSVARKARMEAVAVAEKRKSPNLGRIKTHRAKRANAAAEMLVRDHKAKIAEAEKSLQSFKSLSKANPNDTSLKKAAAEAQQHLDNLKAMSRKVGTVGKMAGKIFSIGVPGPEDFIDWFYGAAERKARRQMTERYGPEVLDAVEKLNAEGRQSEASDMLQQIDRLHKTEPDRVPLILEIYQNPSKTI